MSVHRYVRVRVEIMGSQKYENVGESQSVRIMISLIISTRIGMYVWVCAPHECVEWLSHTTCF
jgi:hypothetical protein